jgi:hypothetical protein
MKIEVHRVGLRGSELLIVPQGRERWERVLKLYGPVGALTGAVTVYARGEGDGPYVYVNDDAAVARMGEHEGCVRVK